MTNAKNRRLKLRAFATIALLFIIAFTLSVMQNPNASIPIPVSPPLGTNYVEVIVDDYEWVGPDYNGYTLSYTYDYGGKQYRVEETNPHSEQFFVQNRLALAEIDGSLPGVVPIKVMVNTSKPAYHRLEIQRVDTSTYAQFLVGKSVLSLSVLGLFFCLKPRRRVQDLIPE